MQTECSPKPMVFARVDRRAVVADFDGGAITSDAGALLLGATDRAIRLVDRFAGCFSDGRAAKRIVHDLPAMIGQRVFGIALGHEDIVDHDELRHDPVLGAVLGRLEAKRPGLAPLAGKSTLNRLEHAPDEALSSDTQIYGIRRHPDLRMMSRKQSCRAVLRLSCTGRCDALSRPGRAETPCIGARPGLRRSG
jgi:hypothetical protein